MKFFKKLFFASLMLACFGFVATSCGGGNSDGLTAETKISGPLGEFFEVVDKNYKMTTEEALTKYGKISIQIKRIAEGGPKDASWSSEPTFNLDIMDADDNVLGSDKSDVVMDKEQLEAIFALGVGETATLTFNVHGELEGAAKLKVSSKWKEEKEKSEMTDNSSDDEEYSDYSSSSSTSSSSDYSDDDNSDDGGYDSSDPYKDAKSSIEDAKRQARSEVDAAYEQSKKEMDKAMDEAYGKTGAKVMKKLSGYDKARKEMDKNYEESKELLGY